MSEQLSERSGGRPIPTFFRPRLESLDARDLPSVTPFTFTLSDCTLVSGSFDYADSAVDAAMASQQIPVSDLTVTVNGQPATLAVQLSAPAAAFALGQFQGLVLSAVAIANGTVEIIDTTGVLNPVSVPVLPVNPITPVPGVGPIDWAVALESYNSALAILSDITSGPSILDGRSGVLQRLMAQHDARKLVVEQAFALLVHEPNPTWQAIFNAFWENAKAELFYVEGELFRAYTNYQTFYQDVQAQYQLLLTVLPPDQRAILTEMPPQFSVPEAYYEEYLLSIV